MIDMKANIILREARKEEAAQIAQLFMLAWPVEEMAQSSGITAEMLHESVTGFAAREDTIYSYTKTFVAEVDPGKGEGRDEIVGAMCGYDGADYQKLKQPIVDILGEDSAFAQLRETEAGEYYLDSVGVLPEHRGKGIGTLFLDYIASKYPGALFRLEVEGENEAAVHVYKKCGFDILPYMEMKREG